MTYFHLYLDKYLNTWNFGKTSSNSSLEGKLAGGWGPPRGVGRAHLGVTQHLIGPLPCQWSMGGSRESTPRSSIHHWFESLRWSKVVGWASLGLEGPLSATKELHQPMNCLRTHATAIRKQSRVLDGEAVEIKGWSSPWPSPNPTSPHRPLTPPYKYPHGSYTL